MAREVLVECIRPVNRGDELYAHLQEPVAEVLHCFPPVLQEPVADAPLLRLAGDCLTTKAREWSVFHTWDMSTFCPLCTCLCRLLACRITVFLLHGL